MAKVTLNVNLFPCSRDLPTCSYTDLTDNLQLANRLVKAATQIFWLRGGTARFSGYVWEGEEGISIQLWHKGRRYRTIRFSGIDLSAVLHIDVRSRTLAEAIGCDVLGDLYRAESQLRRAQDPGLEMIFTGPPTVPRAKGSFCRKGSREATRQSRQAIVNRLMDYLETGS